MVDELRIVISGDARRLISELRKSGVEIKSFSGQAGQGSKSVGGLDASVGGLIKKFAGPAGIALAAVGAARAIATFGKESEEIARRSQRLENATDALGKRYDINADVIVEAIQRASGHTISRMGAMEAANKALLFGIAGSEEELARLSEIAVTLGRAMGQNATKSMDDLTTAMARQSPLILDNLGITFKLEDAYRIYAESLGKTADQLTRAEQEQAFLSTALIKGEEKMRELGGVQDDWAASSERATAATEDLKGAVGEFLAPMRAEYNQVVYNAATGLTEWLQSGQEVGSVLDENTDKLKDNAAANELTAEEVQKHKEALTNFAVTQAGFINEMNNLEEQRLESEREFAQKREDVRADTSNRIEENERRKNEELTALFAEFQEAQNQARLSGNSQAVGQLETRYEEEKNKTIEHYDELNAEIRGKRDEQFKDLVDAQNREAEERRKHIEDLKLKTTLGILEAEGKLEDLVGFAGVSAEDAFELIKSGVITVNDDLARGISEANTKLTGSSGDYKQAEQQNQAAVRAALNQTVSDYKILEQASQRAAQQIQEDARKAQSLTAGLSAADAAALQRRIAASRGPTSTAAVPGMPGFQEGGLVGGPVGMPTLAQVHGGEIILNPSQLGEIVSVLQQSLQVQAMTMQQMAMMSQSEAVRPGSTDFGKAQLLAAG
jgi:hypothetical protein